MSTAFDRSAAEPSAVELTTSLGGKCARDPKPDEALLVQGNRPLPRPPNLNPWTKPTEGDVNQMRAAGCRAILAPRIAD
jgi:hypothetical protein